MCRIFELACLSAMNLISYFCRVISSSNLMRDEIILAPDMQFGGGFGIFTKHSLRYWSSHSYSAVSTN
jgi:hypothetical protein